MNAIIKIRKCIQEVKHQFHYDESQSSGGRVVYGCVHCEEIIEVVEDTTAAG